MTEQLGEWSEAETTLRLENVEDELHAEAFLHTILNLGRDLSTQTFRTEKEADVELEQCVEQCIELAASDPALFEVILTAEGNGVIVPNYHSTYDANKHVLTTGLHADNSMRPLNEYEMHHFTYEGVVAKSFEQDKNVWKAELIIIGIDLSQGRAYSHIDAHYNLPVLTQTVNVRMLIHAQNESVELGVDLLRKERDFQTALLELAVSDGGGPELNLAENIDLLHATLRTMEHSREADYADLALIHEIAHKGSIFSDNDSRSTQLNTALARGIGYQRSLVLSGALYNFNDERILVDRTVHKFRGTVRDVVTYLPGAEENIGPCLVVENNRDGTLYYMPLIQLEDLALAL
jgi:hypothetical protein